jgi:hypothetical protein
MEGGFVFAIFGHPTLEFPLQYIGVIHYLLTEPMRNLFGKVAEILHFAEAPEFWVLGKYGPINTSSRFNEEPFMTEGPRLLRFQLEPGLPLPETNHKWLTVAPLVGPPRYDKESDLLVLFTLRSRETRPGPLVETLVFKYDDPERPILKIQFASETRLAELVRFVAEVAELPYDESSETVTLYRQDGDTGRMSGSVVADCRNRGVHFDFLKLPAGHRIWARVEKKTVDKLVGFTVIYCDDGYCMTGVPHGVRLPAGSTLDDLRKTLIQWQLIPDVPNLRFVPHISGRVFGDRLLKPGDVLNEMTAIRVDRVPIEQRDVSLDELIQVFVADNPPLLNHGSPTLVLYDPKEPTADFIARVNALLQIEAVNDDRLVYYASGSFLRKTEASPLEGPTPIGELIALAGVDGKPGICIEFMRHSP